MNHLVCRIFGHNYWSDPTEDFGDYVTKCPRCGKLWDIVADPINGYLPRLSWWWHCSRLKGIIRGCAVCGRRFRACLDDDKHAPF